MVIDTAKLKVSTKTMLGLVVGFGSLMQIPAVSEFVAAHTLNHRNLTSLIATVMGIYALLHNPEVRDALGIKTTTQLTQTSEEVSLEKDDAK